MDAALLGDHPVLEALRQQVEACGVPEREWTGAGFFTSLDTSHWSPKLLGSARISGVFTEITGLAHGAGFVLLVENGLVSILEGFSYEEDWPETVRSFEVHERSDEPDLSNLSIFP